VAIDTGDLFPRLTTWVGFRRDRFLSDYMFSFLKRIVPGANRAGIEQIIHGHTQGENVISFPGIKPVQNHPLFGSQFKAHCTRSAADSFSRHGAIDASWVADQLC